MGGRNPTLFIKGFMKPTKIIIHCTDSPNGKVYPISQLEKDHKARGFKTIGYHGVIQPDGEYTQTRPFNEIGAHCRGENETSIGISLVGSDKFPQVQLDVLRYKLDGIFMVYNIPKWAVYCHYQFKSAQDQGKTCPNIPINQLLFWYWSHDDKILNDFILRKV